MKKVKALVLISGGLDSVLAAKVLQEQGIEVHGICFVSNFFGCEAAREAARENKIPLQVVDISKELLDLVKSPPSGLGKNLNPCIDCHTLMLKKAKAYIDKGEYDLLATGEVLGQRPFSQNKDSLMAIQKKLGMDVLRPLSAQSLDETDMENKGLVDRKRLLDIRGRSRDEQQKLVSRYKIKSFSSPAGGCLLTDPGVSKRLSDMLWYWPDCNTKDVELLKCGRVFWFKLKDDYVLAVVGREKEDNDKLDAFKGQGDAVLELKETTGPLTLVRGGNTDFFKSKEQELDVTIPEELNADLYCKKTANTKEEILKSAALLTGSYKKEARGERVTVMVTAG
jgi:tRNA U34 2-thiouridine synthase MnmA/TrmU